MGFHHTSKVSAGVKPPRDFHEARVFRAFFMGLDTPRALGAWLRYEWGEHKQLANLRVEPLEYCDRRAFQRDYAVCSFLGKYPGLVTGVDTRAEALLSHDKAEERNAITNQLFRQRASGSLVFATGVEHAISRAQQKIARVLDGWSLDECLQSCRYGPGATFDLKRSEATLWNKTTSLSVTAHAARHAKWLLADPVRFEAITGIRPEGPFSPRVPMKLVHGNKLTTVPKNAKTDRCICIEPNLNLELQLGVGAMLRRRLRNFCQIDLDDQTRNQVLAQRAYFNGYATLDLSAASDSITTELIYALLPLDFAIYLDEIRSRYTLNGKTWVKAEKFASMGNGFCFELETLVFWALSSSIAGWAAVYGDDIVIPATAYGGVVACLTAVGFVVNDQKSFSDGCFFESCGKHYYEGIDVTPAYQKERIADEESAIRFVNRIRRLGLRLGDGHFCDVSLRACWLDAIELFFRGKPRCVQPFVSASGAPYQGDHGVALNSEELRSIGFSTAAWPMKLPGLVQVHAKSGAEHQLSLYYVELRAAQGRAAPDRRITGLGTRDPLKRILGAATAAAFSRGVRDSFLSEGVATPGSETARRKSVQYFDGVSDAHWF